MGFADDQRPLDISIKLCTVVVERLLFLIICWAISSVASRLVDFHFSYVAGERYLVEIGAPNDEQALVLRLLIVTFGGSLDPILTPSTAQLDSCAFRTVVIRLTSVVIETP